MREGLGLGFEDRIKSLDGHSSVSNDGCDAGVEEAPSGSLLDRMTRLEKKYEALILGSAAALVDVVEGAIPSMQKSAGGMPLGLSVVASTCDEGEVEMSVTSDHEAESMDCVSDTRKDNFQSAPCCVASPLVNGSSLTVDGADGAPWNSPAQVLHCDNSEDQLDDDDILCSSYINICCDDVLSQLQLEQGSLPRLVETLPQFDPFLDRGASEQLQPIHQDPCHLWELEDIRTVKDIRLSQQLADMEEAVTQLMQKSRSVVPSSCDVSEGMEWHQTQQATEGVVEKASCSKLLDLTVKEPRSIEYSHHEKQGEVEEIVHRRFHASQQRSPSRDRSPDRMHQLELSPSLSPESKFVLRLCLPQSSQHKRQCHCDQSVGHVANSESSAGIAALAAAIVGSGDCVTDASPTVAAIDMSCWQKAIAAAEHQAHKAAASIELLQLQLREEASRRETMEQLLAAAESALLAERQAREIEGALALGSREGEPSQDAGSTFGDSLACSLVYTESGLLEGTGEQEESDSSLDIATVNESRTPAAAQPKASTQLSAEPCLGMVSHTCSPPQSCTAGSGTSDAGGKGHHASVPMLRLLDLPRPLRLQRCSSSSATMATSLLPAPPPAFSVASGAPLVTAEKYFPPPPPPPPPPPLRWPSQGTVENGYSPASALTQGSWRSGSSGNQAAFSDCLSSAVAKEMFSQGGLPSYAHEPDPCSLDAHYKSALDCDTHHSRQYRRAPSAAAPESSPSPRIPLPAPSSLINLTARTLSSSSSSSTALLLELGLSTAKAKPGLTAKVPADKLLMCTGTPPRSASSMLFSSDAPQPQSPLLRQHASSPMRPQALREWIQNVPPQQRTQPFRPMSSSASLSWVGSPAPSLNSPRMLRSTPPLNTMTPSSPAPTAAGRGQLERRGTPIIVCSPNRPQQISSNVPFAVPPLRLGGAFGGTELHRKITAPFAPVVAPRELSSAFKDSRPLEDVGGRLGDSLERALFDLQRAKEAARALQGSATS